MIDAELEAEIRELRGRYILLGKDLGEVINEQQDKILSLMAENKRLKRENWNLRQTKRRRR